MYYVCVGSKSDGRGRGGTVWTGPSGTSDHIGTRVRPSFSLSHAKARYSAEIWRMVSIRRCIDGAPLTSITRYLLNVSLCVYKVRRCLLTPCTRDAMCRWRNGRFPAVELLDTRTCRHPMSAVRPPSPPPPPHVGINFRCSMVGRYQRPQPIPILR